MEFSERVLILQVGRFKENDVWVRFLSPTRGLLSAFAFGGSHSKQRFVGCLDVFNQVLFRVQTSRRGTYLALQEGVLLAGPSRLRHDWARFGIAANCAKFIQAFGIAEEGASLAYKLFIDILQVLEEADTLPLLLPFFFRARLAFDQGYAFDASCCTVCGHSMIGATAYLLVREGRLVCSACSISAMEHPLMLSPAAVQALTTVLYSPPAHWIKINLALGAKNECARAIDGFIQYHVGLTWENGRFLRN